MCLKPKYAIKSISNSIIKGRTQKFKIKIITKSKYYEIEEKQKNKLKEINIIKLPCKQCSECRAIKAKDWATRAYIETKENKENMFLTLTYKDENLKYIDGEKTLNIKDIQNFKKRLRQHLYRKTGTRPIIKTLECGEYGDKKGRPHYHMLMWGYRAKDLKYYKKTKLGDTLYTSKEIEKIWKNGKIIIGNITYESAAYVGRYTTKKLQNRKLNEKIKKPFINCSRGKQTSIGREYFIKNKIEINTNIYISTKKGVIIREIPDYFKRLLIKQKEQIYDELKKDITGNYYNYEREKINKKWLKRKQLWKKFNPKINWRTLTTQEYIEWKNFKKKYKNEIHELLKLNETIINEWIHGAINCHAENELYKREKLKNDFLIKTQMTSEEYDIKQKELKKEKYKQLKNYKKELDI